MPEKRLEYDRKTFLKRQELLGMNHKTTFKAFVRLLNSHFRLRQYQEVLQLCNKAVPVQHSLSALSIGRILDFQVYHYLACFRLGNEEETGQVTSQIETALETYKKNHRPGQGEKAFVNWRLCWINSILGNLDVALEACQFAFDRPMDALEAQREMSAINRRMRGKDDGYQVMMTFRQRPKKSMLLHSTHLEVRNICLHGLSRVSNPTTNGMAHRMTDLGFPLIPGRCRKKWLTT